MEKDIVRRLFEFNQFQRDEWVEKMARSVPAGASVLDVGAGSAPYRHLFAHTSYKTQDFCQLAPGQLLDGSAYTKIDYVCDVTQIPIADSVIDFILCTEVIEHVPFPIDTIREMLRILKPGGSLFISAPLGSGLHQTPFHFYGGYTPYWYRKFSANNGGEVISIEPNGGYFRYYAQEALRFAIRSQPWRLKQGFILATVWLPFWLVSCFHSFAAALLGQYLNSKETEPDFTVGYHVVIKKSQL